MEEVVRQEKLVTATKKGAAVLDQWLPEQYKATYHVLQRVWFIINVLSILSLTY